MFLVFIRALVPEMLCAQASQALPRLWVLELLPALSAEDEMLNCLSLGFHDFHSSGEMRIRIAFQILGIRRAWIHVVDECRSLPLFTLKIISCFYLQVVRMILKIDDVRVPDDEQQSGY